jgi:hypothetical protein
MYNNDDEPWSWWRWDEEVDAFTRVHNNAKMPAKRSILVITNFTIVVGEDAEWIPLRLPSYGWNQQQW